MREQFNSTQLFSCLRLTWSRVLTGALPSTVLMMELPKFQIVWKVEKTQKYAHRIKFKFNIVPTPQPPPPVR